MELVYLVLPSVPSVYAADPTDQGEEDYRGARTVMMGACGGLSQLSVPHRDAETTSPGWLEYGVHVGKK